MTAKPNKKTSVVEALAWLERRGSKRSREEMGPRYGIVDTGCFSLFDRSPHAWGRVAPWCTRREEFVRRVGFVLLACLALHDKKAGDGASRRRSHCSRKVRQTIGILSRRR